MMHFVYAGQPDDGRIQSPYSITKNLYYYLAARTPVRYYQWDSHEPIALAANDVFLGHPNYDLNTVTQRAFQQPCRAKCLIHPFHHVRVADNWPFDHLNRLADKHFAICGPYWYDTMSSTQFAHWQAKMIRLDMAVDSHIYPYLKQTFAPPGHRRLVYVGSATPNKNLGFLTQIMRRLHHVHLDWYGGDSQHPLARLPNVHTVGWITLDATEAQKICDRCDIMVSVSNSDANPTTILETMAWGLIQACSPQSGYYNDPLFTRLDLNSLEQTCVALTTLLTADTAELVARSQQGRHRIETDYTWDRFCGTVWANLQTYL